MTADLGLAASYLYGLTVLVRTAFWPLGLSIRAGFACGTGGSSPNCTADKVGQRILMMGGIVAHLVCVSGLFTH